MHGTFCVVSGRLRTGPEASSDSLQKSYNFAVASMSGSPHFACEPYGTNMNTQYFEQSDDPIEQFREESFRPAMFRHGKSLYISEGSQLPLNVCIRCRKEAKGQVRKALRNPFNPLTWFGGQPRISVPLCQKHRESHMIALSLTFSLLAMGAVILGVGIYTLSVTTSAVGLLLILCCGVFRATVPVWSRDARREPMEISGTGEEFRGMFPECDPGEE